MDRRAWWAAVLGGTRSWTRLSIFHFTSLHFLTSPCPMGFPGGSMVKNPLAMWEPQEMQVQSLGREHPLEEGVTTHSSILAWTEDHGGLQSIGSQRVGHN